MAEFIQKNGLGYWQDDRLSPFPHGFFSRLGGVSQGDISGLNCGYGADDDRKNVDENRNRVCVALGANSPLQTVYQHHSADIHIATEPMESPVKADAIVTKTAGLPIGVLTADCGPILFADHKNGVIGAAHAGWRGAFAGILGNTISAMCDLGAEVSEIRAALGACISQPNYEVGEEFVEQFMDENPDYAQYFSGGNKPHFNLPRFILDHLRAEGIDNPEWIGQCTYADAEKYYSFRRATHQKQADYGRLISSIMIPA